MNEILVENQVDKVVMPDNLKVGLMVAEQRKKCASGGCTEEFYGLGFGQSPFHVLPVLSKALAESAAKLTEQNKNLLLDLITISP